MQFTWDRTKALIQQIDQIAHRVALSADSTFSDANANILQLGKLRWQLNECVATGIRAKTPDA